MFSRHRLSRIGRMTDMREDLYSVDTRRLNEIKVMGTVYGGRWFPAATS